LQAINPKKDVSSQTAKKYPVIPERTPKQALNLAFVEAYRYYTHIIALITRPIAITERDDLIFFIKFSSFAHLHKNFPKETY